MYCAILLSRRAPTMQRGYATSMERGSAEVKYQRIEWVPHSELRFRTELNQRTSNSGHKIRRHIIESISIVNPMHIRAVLTQYFTASKRETDLLSKSASPIGPRRRIMSHLKTTAATICKKMRITQFGLI